jgi:hypothetical protein
MTPLLSDSDLIEKITAIVTYTDANDLRYSFGDEHTQLACAVWDGMAALMEMARDEEIGWDLNAGLRCDIPFELFGICVCDNRMRHAPDFELRAATAQGALAAGILVILQARLKLKQVRSVLLQQLGNRS